MKEARQLTYLVILLVAENLSMVGCSSVSGPAGDWLKVEAGAFSIYTPPGWEFHKRQGIDSYVGEFAGNGVVLAFDFGRYSNPLKEYHEPAYVVAHEVVGGYGAKIVSPKVSGHGVTGIYFAKVSGSDKLCLYGQDLTDTQQELALRIFRTIQFKRDGGDSF